MAGFGLGNTSTHARNEVQRLMLERMRLALLIILIGVGVFSVADLKLSPPGIAPLYLLRVIQLAIVLTVLFTLRLPGIGERAVSVALLTVAAVYVTIAGQGIVTHDAVTTPFVF